MTHCPKCSQQGTFYEVATHQEEKKHDGQPCEGSWERVIRDSGFSTNDSQFVCWQCGRVCVKASMPS